MRTWLKLAGRKALAVVGIAGAVAVLGVALSLAPTSVWAQAAADETCRNCHAAHVDGMAATPHGNKNVPGSPASVSGCATCHGTVAEHAAKMGGRGVGGIIGMSKKSSSTPEQRSAVCLGCHESNRHLALWDQGKHKKMDVSCGDCHNVHGLQRNVTVAAFTTTFRELQYETCTQCHRDIRSQLNKNSHHPIVEGKVKCSDCHNPHGSLSKALLKFDTINQLCTTCHADKRGPYVWGHPPVEENCATCHMPHGSKTNALLNEKVPNLCQDCHDWSRHPGSYYDAKTGFAGSAPSSRMIARSCLNCHNQVHGSNAPGVSGKRFVR